MALNVKAGSFVTNTSTGNQSITGVGFQPKLILFFYTDNDSFGSVEQGMNFGFAAWEGVSGNNDRFAYSFFSADNVGTSDTHRRHVPFRIIMLTNGTGGVTMDAEVSSMDSDGFTINITAAVSPGVRVGYIAFAGSDITNIKVGEFTGNNATGNQSVTGLGFKPDIVFMFTANMGSNSNSQHATGAWGAMCGQTEMQATMGFMSEDSVGTTDSYRVLRHSRVLQVPSITGTSSIDDKYVSMDSDGFTINHAVAHSANISYVAIKGGVWDILGFPANTTTGNQALRGTGFIPKGFLTGNQNASISSAIGAHMVGSIGGSSGSADEWCLTYADIDALATQDCWQAFFQDRVHYVNLTNQSVDGYAETVSLDTNGLTINIVDATASATDFFIIACGDTSARAADVIKDTFTEASNTTLVSHTPDTGGAWSKLLEIGGTQALQVDATADTLTVQTGSLSDGISYQNAQTLNSPDYMLEFRYKSGLASDDPIGVVFRATDSSNFYVLRVIDTAFRVYKRVAGVNTGLGAGNTSFTASADELIRVEIEGTEIRVYYSGVLLATYTDSALSSAGKAGVAIGQQTVTGDDMGTQTIDDFRVRYLSSGATPVSITKSLKYTVKTTPSALTKSLKYTLKLTPAALTKSLTYRIKNGIALTKSLKYTLKTALSITKSLKYTVKKTPAALTKQLIYRVRLSPSITKQLIYKVKANFSIQKSLKYTVKKAVSITKSLQYTIKRTPAAITKSLKYTIKTTPSAVTKSLQYAVKKSTAITKSLQYEIRTATQVNIQKSLKYTVKTSVAIMKSLKYTIKQTPAAITKSLKYTIKTVPAAMTKSLRYAVRPTIAITKSLKYTVKSAVAISKSLKYTIKTTPAALQKTLRYTIKRGTAITKSLKYTLKTTPAALTKSLRYAIKFGTFSITKSLKYTVKTGTAITKSAKYTVKTSVAITKSLTYRMSGQGAIISKSLRYAVKNPRSVTKSLQYAVKRAPAALTKQLIYKVKAGVAITKNLKYTVKTTASALTKSLTYRIKRTPGAITKALQYKVKKGTAITKSLQYNMRVAISTVIQKSLKYTVEATAPRVTKTLTYHVRLSDGYQDKYILQNSNPYTDKYDPQGNSDDYSDKYTPQGDVYQNKY